MTYLISGLGTGDIIVLLIIIILIIMLIYKFGKNAGEKKVYKEILQNSQSKKSTEIIRLEKLLADKMISQEEFEILKNKLK